MIPGQDVTLHIKFIPSDAPYKLNNIVIESTSCGAVLTKGKDSIFVGDKLYRSSGKIMATTNCIYTIMGNKVEQYSPRGKYSEALSKVHQSSKLEHPLASSVIDFELITCANNGLYYTIGNDVYHLKSLKSATTKVTSSPRKILKLYGHENAIYAVTEAESEDNFDISVYDCKSEKLFYFQDLLFKDGDANDIIFCGIQSESIIGIIGLLQEYIYIGRSNGEIINIELQEDSDKIYFDGIPKAIWTEGDLIVIKGENSCARFKLEGIQKENLDADLELLEFVRKCQNIFDEEGEDEGFELVEDSADVASPKSDRETSIVAETGIS